MYQFLYVLEMQIKPILYRNGKKTDMINNNYETGHITESVNLNERTDRIQKTFVK